MIKVLLIVRWPVGGIRTFMNYIYSTWNSPNIELHIVTPNIAEVEVLKEQLKAIPCVWYATEESHPGFLSFFKAVRKAVHANRYDLIHPHGFTSALSIAMLLPFLSCKSIFTSHDVLNESQFSGVAGYLKRILMPLLLNRFSVIHSVSEDASENLKQTLPSINSSKCRVISNGVDTERFFSAKPHLLKQELGVAPDVLLIGFFGRFMAQKGFKYLIEAIAQLEQKFPGKYKVVTFGGDGFIREEMSVLEKRNLKSLFHFHAPVPDISSFIKGCDIVVMPSLWEACGLLAMEVLSAGKPLVASNCIGLREVCAGTPAFMVEPGSAASLEQGILAASQETSAFIEYAPVAKERFNIRNTQVELQNLYQLLGSKKVLGSKNAS